MDKYPVDVSFQILHFFGPPFSGDFRQTLRRISPDIIICSTEEIIRRRKKKESKTWGWGGGGGSGGEERIYPVPLTVYKYKIIVWSKNEKWSVMYSSQFFVTIS